MIGKILTVLFFAAAALFFAGCETANEDESNLPWSRPASWEGQAPGFGGGTGAAPGARGY